MSAPAAGGRIPIRLDPLAGESLDGWLDAYAQRLRISTVALGEALEIPVALLRARSGARFALAHDAPDPARVAARACGIDPAHVEALWLGLVRYDRLISQRLGAFPLAQVLRPLRWSRFCPTCLAQNGGRWLAAWRLPWYLACPTHHTMLATRCPQCAAPQRDRGPRSDHVDELLTRCGHPSGEPSGRRDGRCRHDLTSDVSAEPVPRDLIDLQTDLGRILDAELTDSEARQLLDRLVDVHIVATHVGLELRAITGDRRDAGDMLGGPLIEAQRVLADPRGPRLRELANSDRLQRPIPLPSCWRNASPALTAALLQHRDERLRPTDRLRCRSMTVHARRPDTAEPSGRLHAMPLALWPDWAIRLRPATMDAKNFRIAACAALCLPGTTATLPEITDQWPATATGLDLSELGVIVTRDPQGTHILRALCMLADELDRGSAPIDYDRRRSLASEITLLSRDAWAPMCRAGGTPTGGAFKLRAARLWLWELLTGGVAEQASAQLRPTSNAELARYQRFAVRLPAPTARRLVDHARGLLDAHECTDEPLTWSPRGDDIAVETLPGPDPHAVHRDRVRAVLAQRITPGDAGAELGITLEHLRYLVRAHALTDVTGLASGAPPRARLAARVTPCELRQLVDDGMTLTALAARYDVRRDTMRTELVSHGIPVPANHRPRHRINEDWLREQYIDKRRTMPDIAAETGASPATIARLIHEYAIPARGRGTPSHRQRLTAG